MRRLLVLGAGTAGTMVVNKLRHRLDKADWQITVVDQDDRHFYQPGYLFLPFGTYTRRTRWSSRPGGSSSRTAWTWSTGEVDRVEPDGNEVLLTDGRRLPYDYLVIATGVQPRPDQTPGHARRRPVADAASSTSTPSTARSRSPRRCDDFDGGRLVVHIVDMPIKCPVAPLEFAFLADAYFRRRGMRDRVELVYATPLPGAFTKPIASARLGAMLDDRKIAVEPDFLVERVDGTTLVSYDEREIPFDLLVTVPLNMGADYVARSGLGNELNLVPVDRHTLLSKAYDNIFALGDANDIPASKAGSVAHFSVEVFVDNFAPARRAASR